VGVVGNDHEQGAGKPQFGPRALDEVANRPSGVLDAAIATGVAVAAVVAVVRAGNCASAGDRLKWQAGFGDPAIG